MQIHQIMEWADTLCRAILKEMEQAESRETYSRIKAKLWGKTGDEKELVFLLDFSEEKNEAGESLLIARLTVFVSFGEAWKDTKELGIYKNQKETVQDIKKGTMRRKLLTLLPDMVRQGESRLYYGEISEASPEYETAGGRYTRHLPGKAQ
ncbi:MAG TPA: hypothetical protein H9738_10275 [Candidatus Blautia pullistercoris]|uniref:Uncharacterized protein n=1 Tax=Candidatus Blautia pullistercoris TaxID=2838499 RepID=A0A9D1VMN6_9FIRM|nr:hypothetical protein [Candidatus Blautia pullistercoris]